jgi:DinB superfamily
MTASEQIQATVTELVAGLNEVEKLAAKIANPATAGPGGWNARDVLAHMAFWESEAQKNLRLIQEGKQSEIHRPADDREVDDWNERVFRQNQATPWPMALRYWSDLRRQNIKQLQKVDPATLAMTHSPSRTYFEIIVVDTNEHDREHLPQLRQLAGSTQE